MKKIFYLIYSYFLFSNVKLMFLLSMGFVLPLTAQDDSAYAKVVGKMSDVMWKGDLEGKILVDTLLSYDSMYGLDRKSTRLNSSHSQQSRMPSSA